MPERGGTLARDLRAKAPRQQHPGASPPRRVLGRMLSHQRVPRAAPPLPRLLIPPEHPSARQQNAFCLQTNPPKEFC